MATGSASSMEGTPSNDTGHPLGSHLGPTSEMSIESVIILPRSELDRANKDKRHYPETFQVTTTINRSVVIFISILILLIEYFLFLNRCGLIVP